MTAYENPTGRNLCYRDISSSFDISQFCSLNARWNFALTPERSDVRAHCKQETFKCFPQRCRNFKPGPCNKSETNLGALITHSQVTLPKLWSMFLKGGKAQRYHCSITGIHSRLQKILFGYMSTGYLDDYIYIFLLPPAEESLYSAVISLRLQRLHEMKQNSLHFEVRDALYNQIKLFCNVSYHIEIILLLTPLSYFCQFKQNKYYYPNLNQKYQLQKRKKYWDLIRTKRVVLMTVVSPQHFC